MDVEKNIRKIRVILWGLLVLATAWLLYMGVVPSGRTTYTSDFSGPNGFFGKLTPSERIRDKNTITGDPAYFSLRPSRRFEKAVLTIKYKNNTQLPITEAGVLADKTVWRYQLKPVENQVIDRLSDEWEKIEEDGVIFLQREKKYAGIDEFLNNLPPAGEIAAYNYDLGIEYILTDYTPKNEVKIIDYALRGDYQIYTYLKDEELDFEFDFFDLNKNKDADPVEINLYYRNELIDTRRLADDGIDYDSGVLGEPGKLILHLAGLPEGAYKIEVKAGDDIVTREIRTSQSKISFLNKIWLYKTGRENFGVYTDAGEVLISTINPGSLQTVKMGGNSVEVSETYKQFSVKSEKETLDLNLVLNLEKDGVILAGRGVFSFDRESIIDPEIKKVDANLNLAGINYIIASYGVPKGGREWKIARAEFDLTNVYREDRKLSFIISVPGLRDSEEGVEIGEVKIELSGTSLWDKVKAILTNRNGRD